MLRAQSSSESGFTLIELVITLAILGILVAITAVGITGMRPKAQLDDAVSEIAATVSTARGRAMADNAAVWVGWLPSTGGTADSHLVVYRDWNMNFDPSTAKTLALVEASAGNTADYETSNCPGTCRHDELESVLDVPPRVHEIAPSTLSAATISALPGPYRWWPGALSALSLPTTGCSFCEVPNGTGQKNGWLEFLPSGQVRVYLATGTTQPKGVLLALGVSQDNVRGDSLIIVTVPFGLTTEASE